jgi:hypothetical protein
MMEQPFHVPSASIFIVLLQVFDGFSGCCSRMAAAPAGWAHPPVAAAAGLRNSPAIIVPSGRPIWTGWVGDERKGSGGGIGGEEAEEAGNLETKIRGEAKN